MEDESNKPEPDNVVDLWSYRIQRDIRRRNEEIKARQKEAEQRRATQESKKSVSDKIRQALDKYGSFKGLLRKKKDEKDKK